MTEWGYSPERTHSGGVMQSALEKGREDMMPRTPRGLLLRGVVVQNTTTDEEAAPLINDPRFRTVEDPIIPEDQPLVTGASEMYVSIITYSGMPGGKQGFLPDVLVSQERLGMHEGDIWIPRAARIDIRGFLSVSSNPAELDGDHVLIGFMDDQMNMPVVLRSIPHPSSDAGKELLATDPLGVRTRIQREDGEPRYWKHRGAFWGVDTDGNWTLDLTKAHSGEYNEDGTEPDPPEDGANGNFTVRVQEGAKYTVSSSNGTSIVLNANGDIDINAGADSQVITVQGSGLDVQTDEVRLGDGADESAVLGDSWSTAHQLYDNALAAPITGLLSQLIAIIAALQVDGVISPTATVTTDPLAKTLATSSPVLLTVLTQALRGHLSDNVKVRD